MRLLDRTKTLDELDPPPWGEPDHDTHLAISCNRLRRKRIGDLCAEDLRIMIGQGIGLRWLVPLVLELLKRDPLSEGDFHRGDLLATVVRIPAEFWAREWEWRDRVKLVLEGLTAIPKEVNDAFDAFREHTV